jgi:hypothetical protein
MTQQLTKISIEPIVDYKLISNNEQNFELLELMAQNGDLKQSLKKAPPVRTIIIILSFFQQMGDASK